MRGPPKALPAAANTLPTSFVVFGGTGDLMARKIAPALFHLYHDRKLPALFGVIGVSRQQLTDDQFRTHIHHAVAEHLRRPLGEIPSAFLKLFTFHSGRFEERQTYETLAARLGRVDRAWRICANKLYHLAVPPALVEGLVRHLDVSGLTDPCSLEEGWTRVLVEKPFGTNLREAARLDALLGQLFREVQIYRIDHYLAKEMLQNIMAFRFSNNLLEHAWDTRAIAAIDVHLLEASDVGRRGAFYDALGALLDVGQNHLLQMLALVTMEHPGVFGADVVRRERARAIVRLRPLRGTAVARNTARGQYRGYRRTPGVRPASATETYFRVRTVLTGRHWGGVPVLLESGKRMAAVRKEIVVTFRHPIPCLCPPGIQEHFQNRVYFRIEPNPGIAIQFWSKKPGAVLAFEEQVLGFQYPERAVQYTEEYAKLLLDAIAGDQTLFVSSREALASWRFIDPIVRAWRAGAVPLHTYDDTPPP